MRKLLPVVSLMALVLLMAGPARANPIGPNCTSCMGNIIALTYNPTPVSATATTQTFQVTLSINTSGYFAIGKFIDNVAIQVSNNLISSSLVSAPGGIGAWTLVSGGLGSNGCNGIGSGVVCADASPTGTGGPAPFAGGPTYTWVFNLEILTGTLNTSPLGASVKARNVSNAGIRGGDLILENIDLDAFPPPNSHVPEPGSLALLGSGLISVAGMVRRRKVK